jgi:hypothetical protein
MIKNKRAQIAIEYIIFIAIFLLFFQSILLPSTQFSENIVLDVFYLTQTKENIDLLADNITGFSNSSGFGKRTVYFYLPKTSKIISCDSTTKIITYEVMISSQNPKPAIPNCDKETNICTFEKILYIGDSNISCDSIGPGFGGYITIEKDELTGEINVFA